VLSLNSNDSYTFYLKCITIVTSVPPRFATIYDVIGTISRLISYPVIQLSSN